MRQKTSKTAQEAAVAPLLHVRATGQTGRGPESLTNPTELSQPVSLSAAARTIVTAQYQTATWRTLSSDTDHRERVVQ